MEPLRYVYNDLVLQQEFQLKYKEHPFFYDLPVISEEIKTSYDDIFSTKGDIFLKLFIWLGPIKKLILEEPFHAVQKLETFNILEVPSQIVSEVADTVPGTAKMGN